MKSGPKRNQAIYPTLPDIKILPRVLLCIKKFEDVSIFNSIENALLTEVL